MGSMILPTSIQSLLKQSRDFERRVVLATGVFDILHEEHQRFLQKSKQAGDVLLVGVESDARVRQLKGEGRPVNPIAVRISQIEALHIADGVFELPEQFSEPADHLALLREIRPDILAVSSHTPHLQSKKNLIETVGGKLEIVHQHNPAVSTTQILEQETNG